MRAAPELCFEVRDLQTGQVHYLLQANLHLKPGAKGRELTHVCSRIRAISHSREEGRGCGAGGTEGGWSMMESL